MDPAVLEVRRHDRRGRGLYTKRLVKGGEVVLSEDPLLLLVAPEMKDSTCLTCLRAVPAAGRLACPGCAQACFCSDACAQAAANTPWLHSPPVCRAYAAIAGFGLGSEEHTQLRFLLHASGLRACSQQQQQQAAGAAVAAATADAQQYERLMSLQGEPGEPDLAAAAKLLPLLAQALGGDPSQAALLPPLAEAAALLCKEQLNSYGILAAQEGQQAAAAAAAGQAPTAAAVQQPHHRHHHHHHGQEQGDACCSGRSSESGQGERRLRGSGIYCQASLINHECLPNVARFDFFDSGGPRSTRVEFRALHNLPQGTELFQSYCPLHWGLAERQAQCRHVYGFACTCPRCQTESQWSDEEDEDDWETDSGGDAEMATAEEGGQQEEEQGAEEEDMDDVMQGPIAAPPGDEGPLEPAYLRLFLLKYVCPREGCFGTMAPAAPGSPLLACAVCGGTRSEQDFLADLEQATGR